MTSPFFFQLRSIWKLFTLTINGSPLCILVLSSCGKERRIRNRGGPYKKVNFDYLCFDCRTGLWLPLYPRNRNQTAKKPENQPRCRAWTNGPAQMPTTVAGGQHRGEIGGPTWSNLKEPMASPVGGLQISHYFIRRVGKTCWMVGAGFLEPLRVSLLKRYHWK